MSATPVASSIFRFVSVRPVQHVPENDLRDKFITPGELNSELVHSLDRANSFAARAALAANFIAARGGNYVSGFDERLPWVKPLRQVLAALERVHADTDLAAAVHVVQNIVAADADLSDIKRRLGVRRRHGLAIDGTAQYLCRLPAEPAAADVALESGCHAVLSEVQAAARVPMPR